jgi:hypothetical protein
VRSWVLFKKRQKMPKNHALNNEPPHAVPSIHGRECEMKHEIETK